MYEPVILFRKDWQSEEEFNVAKHYFQVEESRMRCPPNSLVIPRYSALPFHQELENDLKYNNCQLINTYAQHCWIAKFYYYQALKTYTAESVFEKDFYRWKEEGPFVLKGCTNSKKHKWNTEMYAEDRTAAMSVASRLKGDCLIGDQDVIIRKYIPLVTYAHGIQGLPFTNEWRFFFYKEKMLTYGFYWEPDDCEMEAPPNITQDAIDFAIMLANQVSQFVNFFVLDIAEKSAGGWILIEINDGTMSGLSQINPHHLYKNLKQALEEN